MSDHHLSHVDEQGNTSMVDISNKKTTSREAIAGCKITMADHILEELIVNSLHTKKGSVIQTAIIAATSAVKKTWDTIPLCHPIPLNSIKINISQITDGFDIRCLVKTEGKTGVEMEALHGASVAALTIYDMCKALGHQMSISDLHLIKKSGGKKDFEAASAK